MRKPTRIIVVCGLLASGWLGAFAGRAQAAEPAANAAKPAAGPLLIQPADLEYQGAFRLPGPSDESGWAWASEGLTYCGDGDPKGPDDGSPGSLFGIGNALRSNVSEIAIPKPVISSAKKLEELNTAKELQPFTDIRGGHFKDYEIYRVGLAYMSKQGKQTAGKLYSCWGQHMEEGQTGPSHLWCETDLSKPRIAGPWSIGDLPHYVTTDYLFEIPEAWAEAHTPGMRLVTGRFRDGGQGSRGPTMLAIAPWVDGDPPPPGTKLKAACLLQYSSVVEEGGGTVKGYHQSDEWSGGAWLTWGDKSAVVFVGTKGLGKCWYGFANGVVWPDEAPFPAIPAPPNDNRGWWSTSFQAQIIFYNPDDLAAVVHGKIKPDAPQPYATLRIDDRLWSIKQENQKYRVGDVAYDRQRGRLYVLEQRVDEDRPLIHVWGLKKPAGRPAVHAPPK